MLKYTVTVPMEQVIEARRECKVLKQGIEMLKEELAKLDELDPVQIGKVAWDKAQEERQQINADIEQSKASAAESMKKRAQIFQAEVNRQAAMKGEDLDNGEYTLIRDKLITDATQLQMMADRNQANYTLLVAIDHYATERNWTGFTVISNAPSVEAFGKAWFGMCETAAQNPVGLAMMQITTEGELRRLLNEYGVLDVAQLPDDEA